MWRSKFTYLLNLLYYVHNIFSSSSEITLLVALKEKNVKCCPKNNFVFIKGIGRIFYNKQHVFIIVMTIVLSVIRNNYLNPFVKLPLLINTNHRLDFTTIKFCTP